MHNTTQLTAGQVATNDVAILLRASWGEAVGLLRRFQALTPSFTAPYRGTSGWRRPGERLAPRAWAGRGLR